MSQNGEVTIEMTADREFFQRLLSIEELGGEPLWDLFDEFIDAARVADRSDEPGANDISMLANIPDLQDEIGDSDITKVKIFELLEVLEPTDSNSYQPGNRFSPGG